MITGAQTMSNERPNIILITTDQQRFDTIHAAGNDHIFTPHLDWMCDRGIRFSRAYTDAPLCVAARATIMTGRQGFSNNLTDNSGKVMPMADHPTLPGILTEAGYQTRAVGKMHFQPRRANYGFEHMELLEEYYRHMARHPDRGVPMNHGIGQNEMVPVLSTVDDTNSLTHWTVDRSVDFLETRDDTRPFFLWTSFSKPHPPWDACREYWDLYENITMGEPWGGDWSAGLDKMSPSVMRNTHILNCVHRFSPEQIAAARRAYYACITQIDYNLGILLSRVKELGLDDNTWLIFTSDHGELLGDHHLGGKSVFLEGSAHIPMMVVPPRGSASGLDSSSTVCDQLACLADILPTCLGIAGVDAPDNADIDGLDLMEINAGDVSRSNLSAQCGEDYYMLINDRYKYFYVRTGGHEYLFDLLKDPHEENNLAGVAEYEDTRKTMRKDLALSLQPCGAEVVRNGDLVDTPESTEKPPLGFWPGFHTPQDPSDTLH